MYQGFQLGSKWKKHWREQHPERVQAHKLVARALQRGDLARSVSCSICGTTKRRIQAHHEDYSKPLEVLWLCSKCNLCASHS